jgi:hypothetical protein
LTVEIAQGAGTAAVLLLGPPTAIYVNNAFISPDGGAATAGVVGDAAATYVSVVRISATTGKPLRVLYRMNTKNGFSYRLLSLDPSSQHILFDAGPTTGSINGWIDQGHLIRLKPAAGDNIVSDVW